MLGGALHTVGTLCVRFRWVVLGIWIVLAIAMTLIVGRVGAETSNDVALPGTESQAAYDLLADRFPPQQNGSSPIVFHVESGTLDDNGSNQQAIVDTYNELAKLSYVSSVTNPFDNEPAAGLISEDGTYAFMPVLLTIDSANLDEATAEEVYRIGTERGLAAGMEVAVGGPVGSTLSVQGTESSEVIGLIAAMVILAFTFSSLVAMGLPILTAILGLSVGLAIVGLFGHVVTIASIAPTLATMIGLGVGIDYSLFLITKHREQMHRHGMSPRDSIAEAVATSGGAIVFAGGTVMVALIALAVAGIPFVTSLGYACAIGVLTAVLAAITLLPAILAILGGAVDRLHLPFIRRPDAPPPETTVWTRWAGIATRHPIRSCVIAGAILIPLIIPFAGLSLGQEDIGVTSPATTERQAFDLVSDGFGPGYNGPLVVAVTLDPPAKESTEYSDEYAEATSMKDELEQTQATLTAEADELEGEQADLEAQAAALKEEQAALTKQAEEVARKAAELRREEARLRVETGSLEREARRLAERAALLQASTSRLTAREAALTNEIAQLKAEEAELQAAIAAAAGNPVAEAALVRALGRVQALEAAATTALTATQRELAANARRATVLARQEQNATARAAEVAAQAAAAQAAAAKVEAEEKTLRSEATALKKEAASLTAQGDALQAEADDLEAQKDAAEAEQDQALALQDDLTDQLTKAGGDPRGTDPRIVKLQDALAIPDNVARVVQPMINDSGNAVILSIIAGTRPADPKTADLVQQLRDDVIPPAIGPGMTANVGGTTAANVDLATLITKRLPIVILTVIGLSFLLLVLAFRSLLVAVQAAITNILSAAASFGVLTFVFQNGHGLDLIGLDSPYGTVPIASYVPLMMFAALFGLSMDYEVFFISHVQGLHAKGVSHATAIREGLGSSAKVIGAAALIMMAVFGSFILIDDPVIKQFGVGLTTAVALAAFLVLFLAPAILMLFGERTWKLPRLLDRILPDLDLEGNKRAHELADTSSADEQALEPTPS